MTDQSIYQQKARELCAELRMYGSPTRGEHLGAKQSGTILWERNGWPAVEAKIAQFFAEAEAEHLSAIGDLQRTIQTDGTRIAKLEAALRVAEVAFDCLDPANHAQTSDAELAKLITTARQTVSDALSKLDQQEGRG